MSLGVQHAAVVMLLDDGRYVQRPMGKIETDIVCAMLAEHDSKVMKVIPCEGIRFKATGEILKE